MSRLIAGILVFVVLPQSVIAQSDLRQYQNQCESIGFRPKTEKFGECVLELYSRTSTGSISNGTLDQEGSQCLQMGFKQGTRELSSCQLQLKQMAIQQQQFSAQQQIYETQMQALQKQRDYDQAEALFGIANQALGVAGGGRYGGGGQSSTIRARPPTPVAPLRIVPPSGNAVTCGYQGPTLVCR
jgi:hypothetical protein